jgi:hypothetical protein
MDEGFPARMFDRARELEQTGLGTILASQTAWLEERIRQWPSSWGDDLVVHIYGDFDAPTTDLYYPSLGITVHPDKVENTIIRGALTVLRSTVHVSEKSIPALIDAARRINILLGGYTLYEWGNGGMGWWSWVTHGTGGGILMKLTHVRMTETLDAILALSDEVRRKIDAALYWVRAPRNLLLESYRPDILRVYSSYWNAFECLVDGVNIRRRRDRISRSRKQELIDEFFDKLSTRPTAGDIERCYQTVVNPGFVGKATHALRVCFDNQADLYVDECFTRLPEQDQLYKIRNAINHGEIDAENPLELLRVEARMSILWMIVWRMFGRFVPFPTPVDPSGTDEFLLD